LNLSLYRSQFEFSQRFGFVISMAVTANGSRKSSRVAAKEASKPRENKQRKLKKTMSVAVEAEKKKKKQPAGPRPQHSHPPYFQMAVEAIASLRERMGSSHRAIAKYIEDHYKGELPSNFKKLLTNQLRILAEKGKLVQVKRSFKLTEELKKSSQVKAIKAASKPPPSGNPPAAKKPKPVGQVKVKNVSTKSPKPKAAKKTKAKPAGKSKPKAVSEGKSAPPPAPAPAPAPPASTPKVQKTASVASIKKEKPSSSKAAKSKPIKTSTPAKSTPAPRKSPRAAPPAASKKPITSPPPKKKKKTA
jgi:histone H1/5